MNIYNILGCLMIIAMMFFLLFMNVSYVAVLINIIAIMVVTIGTVGAVMAANHNKLTRRRVYLLAGKISFNMGIIVAVVGLISLLSNLEGPQSIGPNIAVALTSILYGSMMKMLFDILHARESRFE